MTRTNFCRSLLISLLAAALSGCATADERAPIHVLFVGNSLTYVGNLPGVLETLSASNGKAVVTEMLVKGGATLNDRAADSSVQKALGSAHYDFVVLQERGGDVLCFGTAFQVQDNCDSRKAHIELGRAVLAHGAKPIVLGTFQQLELASRALEEKERELAEQIGAMYIPVSERFRQSQVQLPKGEWLNADKSHPGPDLVLLEAVWLYAAMFGSPPAASELHAEKPMYGPEAHFDGSAPASTQQVAAPVSHHTYTKSHVSRILQIVKDSGSRP